jgi:Tryptophan RNA-binding attenuator protein inhibitory protein
MANTSINSELNAMPDLERPCEACNGDGGFRGQNGRVRCGICNGSGWEPTEFGEKILALVSHNFGAMLEDATNVRKARANAKLD